MGNVNVKWVEGERVMLQIRGGPWRSGKIDCVPVDDSDLGFFATGPGGDAYYGPEHKPFVGHIGRYPTEAEIQEHWPKEVLENVTMKDPLETYWPVCKRCRQKVRRLLESKPLKFVHYKLPEPSTCGWATYTLFSPEVMVETLEF